MLQVGWRRKLKRLVDLSVSATALTLTAPIAGCAALAIVSTMGRPILFRQTRPGRYGRPFTIYKFRTMGLGDGADADRLTAVGRWLRRTSVDELPQLINVLRGEMSLVGPRPLLMEYLAHYDAEQARRHDVLPGITGWAQVNGRNALTHRERFVLDTWYVDHWSLWLDLRILALTAIRVFERSGVSASGHATMPLFAGNYAERVTGAAC